EVMSRCRADVVFVERALMTCEPIQHLVWIGDQAYASATAKPRERKVRHERGRRVECLEPEPAVELDDVPARGEICEMVARLGEKRAEQSKALVSIGGGDEPCGEVAERLGLSVDGSGRVQGEIRAHDRPLV